ncbi:hypothetical protein FXO37_18588 [Capsicum annuum]|nr:hypothetical protein FXO37_18588 [Capsicum annuum]
MVDRYLEDADHLGDAGRASAIRIPSVEGNRVFHITSVMLHLLQMKGLFGVQAHEDANLHLKRYSPHISRVNPIASFPILFDGRSGFMVAVFARESITSWSELTEAFLERYFSHSRMALDQLNNTVVNNAAGSSLVRLSHGIASNLLDQVTKQSRGWHTRDTEVSVGAPSASFVSQEQNKKYEERDANMAKVMTQLDLLTKHMMGDPPKVVNVVASKSAKAYDDEETESLDEEILFLSSQSGGSRPTYQRQVGNQDRDRDHDCRDKERDYNWYIPPHDWEKGKESSFIDPDKVKSEDVLARILIGVEGTDKIDGLPSDTVANLKNDAHIMTIVTRSGRTLGKDVVDLGEDPNEKANEEQANAKRKQLEEPVDNDPKPNDTSVERPTVVEENVESLGAPKPTTMRLLMTDRSIKKPMGVLYDVLVKVDQFIFPADFIILDYEIDHKNPIKLDLDLKNRESPPVKPSIIEPPQLELKPLPFHLLYVFLGEYNILPIILAGDLEPCQVDGLKSIVKKFIRAIGWTITDIIRIPPGIFSHKIKLNVDHVPSLEHQRRLNQLMQEMVKKEIIKCLVRELSTQFQIARG